MSHCKELVRKSTSEFTVSCLLRYGALKADTNPERMSNSLNDNSLKKKTLNLSFKIRRINSLLPESNSQSATAICLYFYTNRNNWLSASSINSKPDFFSLLKIAKITFFTKGMEMMKKQRPANHTRAPLLLNAPIL